MTQDRLFVNFNLDCPPAKGGSSYPGPHSWDFAKATVDGFARTLADAGMKATLFAASDVCKRAATALNGLHESGVEVGLLTDPRFEGYKGFLGSYRIDQQKEIISVGAKTFEDALGRAPESFRPGEFSANNDTVIALCELEFRQGSFSLPERYAAARYCNWRGAYPFAHHVDPLDVRQPGTLELYDVPVTSDFNKTTLNGQEDFTPLFLGSEQLEAPEHAEFLVSNHIDRMKRDGVNVKTITCVSTTCANYEDRGSRASQALGHIIDTVRRLADENGLELAPATLAEIHGEADRLYKLGKHS